MLSEMEFVCVFSGKAILRFVSDINVNNTDWEKFKFFFKLLLFRSIFHCQTPPTKKRAQSFTVLKSLEQVGQTVNSTHEQTEKNLFFRFPGNTSQTFFDCSTYKSVGRDSSVGLATRYGMHGPGIESRVG